MFVLTLCRLTLMPTNTLQVLAGPLLIDGTGMRFTFGLVREHGAWDSCAHFLDARLRVASWNTRGLLGSMALFHFSRGKKH